ncbi:MAG TPA: hypothetical protein VM368_09740 [Flavisolibacter sp.]|nr:hypothetical protein [Flavisolibacter sp.]
MGRKPGLGSLLLAGAAAYGLYKVSKMSSVERNNLLDKGKRMVSDNLGGLKNAFGSSNGTMLQSPSATGNENPYS